MDNREEFLRNLNRWNRQFSYSHRPIWERAVSALVWCGVALAVSLALILIVQWAIGG